MTKGCYHVVKTMYETIVVFVPMVGEYLEIVERGHSPATASATVRVLNHELNSLR